MHIHILCYSTREELPHGRLGSGVINLDPQAELLFLRAAKKVKVLRQNVANPINLIRQERGTLLTISCIGSIPFSKRYKFHHQSA